MFFNAAVFSVNGAFAGVLNVLPYTSARTRIHTHTSALISIHMLDLHLLFPTSNITVFAVAVVVWRNKLNFSLLRFDGFKDSPFGPRTTILYLAQYAIQSRCHSALPLAFSCRTHTYTHTNNCRKIASWRVSPI